MNNSLLNLIRGVSLVGEVSAIIEMLKKHRLIVQGEVTALLSVLRGTSTGGGGLWMGIGKFNSVIIHVDIMDIIICMYTVNNRLTCN